MVFICFYEWRENLFNLLITDGIEFFFAVSLGMSEFTSMERFCTFFSYPPVSQSYPLDLLV